MFVHRSRGAERGRGAAGFHHRGRCPPGLPESLRLVAQPTAVSGAEGGGKTQIRGFPCGVFWLLVVGVRIRAGLRLVELN